jgi:hypothetical protein
MNKTLTDSDLAMLRHAADFLEDKHSLAAANALRALLATQQPEPRAEMTDEVVQWGRVIEIGDRHGMQWAGKTGWRFENDDSVHAFANDIARFALNSRAGEGQ